MRKIAFMCALWIGLLIPGLVLCGDASEGSHHDNVNLFTGQVRQSISLPETAHALRRRFDDPKQLSSNPSGELTDGTKLAFHQDAQGRIERIEQLSLDRQLILEWLQFAYSGREITVTGSDGLSLIYAYDEADRLLQISSGDVLWIRYIYDSNGQLTRCERPDRSYLQIDYDDSGRVQALMAPHGVDLTPVVIARYVYGEGYTDIYNALGIKTRYRFEDDRLTAIEAYDLEESLYRTKRFWWRQGKLAAFALLDTQGYASHSHAFAYDDHGNLILETLYGNLTGERPSEFALDQSGMPCCASIESYSTYWTYDAHNRPTSKREQNGTETQWSYLGEGPLLASKTVIGADGQRILTEYTYNNAGQLISQSDASDSIEKRITERLYSGKYLVLEEDANKSIYQSFDANGRVKERYVTDREGVMQSSWRYAYDADGRISTLAEDALSIRQYRYDAMGRVVLARDSQRRMGVKALYDYAGRLVSRETTDSKQRVFHEGHRYDLLGNCIADIDVYGNVKEHIHDAFGREVTTVFPLVEEGVQPIERIVFDMHDRVIVHSDANGYETRTDYNARGKPIQVTYADGTEELFRYNLDGSLVSKTSREGVVTRINYDGLGRVISQTLISEEGEEISSAAICEEPSNVPQSRSDKQLNVDDDLSHDDFAYLNALGQRVRQSKRVDESGRVTTVTFNSMGLASHIEVKDAFGQLLSETHRTYDAGGRLIGEAQGSQTVEYVYGPMNRLESTTVYSGRSRAATSQWIYDSKGRVASVVKPDGVYLFLEYDGFSRIKRLSSSDSTIDYRYAYDAQHRPVSAYDALRQANVEREYNHKGALVREQMAAQGAVERQVDDEGHLAGIVLPDRSSLTYQYAADRLATVERRDAAGTVLYTHANTQFDEKGRPTCAVLLGSAGELSRRWDKQGRCVETTSKWWSQRLDEHDSSGRLVKARVWDHHGRYALHYAYDTDDRVVQEGGVIDRTYTYDTQGSRIEAAPRLLEDANGNSVERNHNGGCQRLVYDALNRLSSVSVPGVYEKRYTYDGFNRRVSETLTTAKGKVKTLHFLYDDRREIGALNDQGKLVQLRLLGQGIAEDVGAAVAFEFDGVPFAAIHDYRGSVMALVSAQGKPVECYRYTAFGEDVIYNAEGQIADKSLNPWRFSSKRVDPDTGLIHFGHREYDAGAGRWLTEDPLGSADGPNRHAFVRNNPLSFVDPHGLFSLRVLWEDFTNTIGDYYAKARDTFVSVSQTIESNFRVYDDVADDLHFVMREMIGPIFFTLFGLHSEEVEFGVCGKGEVSDKVRVSYINGVLNDRDNDVMESALMISKSHGDVNVHFTYRPTGGLTRDAYNSLLRLLGYPSPASRRLAERWRQLIAEMGGVNGRGMILHYAHSLGGAETDCARQLMTAEELQMIRVIAFGCPKVLPNDGFRHVQSYMGALDFVMIFGLFDYVDAMLSRSPHVIFLGHSGWSAFNDHALSSPIYANKILELGRRFVALYDPRRRSDPYELMDYPER